MAFKTKPPGGHRAALRNVQRSSLNSQKNSLSMLAMQARADLRRALLYWGAVMEAQT